MKNPTLQLMVHGKNIADLTPEIRYPGVTIRQVHRSDNRNYLFIDLHIGSNAKAGELQILFKQSNNSKRILATQTFNLQQRRTGSAQRQGFSNRDAIYLIVPDRFANGDPRNDSVNGYSDKLARDIPGGRHGGDIAGIAAHLEYIAGLGFTMLWPTPMLENAQPINSYHGYAATDFYQIDPRFGSNQSYRELVALARKKNIGMVQDVVLNHIGSNHWWMKDLPSKDWLNSDGKYTETNHIRSTIQDTHAAKSDLNQFADGWFVKTMPDLNQRNPFLANYLIQNAVWWIEYADLAGLRVDTYSYSNKEFLARWSARIMQEYPNMTIVGEEWSMNPNVVAYWQRGNENRDGYRSAMPSMMDFPVYQALHTSLVGDAIKPADMMTMYETIANDFIYPHPEQLTIFEGNHDTPRIFSALNEDLALNKLAMVMLATLRGIPQMFYGAEILMTSPKQRDDGKVRGDFPGGWSDDEVNAFIGTNLTPAQSEMQTFTRRLFNWRKQQSALHGGKLLHFIPQDNCYVYFRFDGRQKIMIVINRNEKEVALQTERFREIIQDAQSANNILLDQTIQLEPIMRVQGKSALILELFSLPPMNVRGQ
ncbi:glycoside hydrolase family 13 protein [Undibacterium sp. FT137W]|uniref:Glycoside hydrolase family 13 protein n=2 Tax=Undibacterium fentianense TaxID=2828728 RepID=A0A941E1A7_9BURK|nr:glycoside hydrolase family 13 protein [Undibacterium fentianense]